MTPITSSPCSWFLVVVALAGFLGCSSNDGTGTSTDAVPGHDADAGGAAGEDTAAPVGEASEAGGAEDDASMVDARRDPRSECPACQAGKCGAELKACAGSSACVDWLMCMNECFEKPDVAACQKACRAGMGPAAKKMDDCSKASCAVECTP